MSQLVKIEYSNTKDIGDIAYPDFSYVNWFWIGGDLKKPQYPIRRESKENDVGDLRHSFQRWDKQYQFITLVNEVMADFISLIPIHSDIYITLENGSRAKCIDFNVEIDWDSNIESVALCTITFTTKSIVLMGLAGGCV